MIFSQNLRKLNLTAHVSTSLSWLGAVIVFTVLAITALNSIDVQISKASIIALKICTWYVILPLCIASFLTGIIQALGTKWGLLKHYWIIVKLILTVISTLLLMLHIQPIDTIANTAINSQNTFDFSTVELVNLISKSGAAIIALLIITTISIYKPWGKINKQQSAMEKKKKSTSFYILIGLIALIVIVIIKHLIEGGGIPNH